MSIHSYRDAGVDIDRGDRFTRIIQNLASKAVSSAIGGFAGAIEIDTAKYSRPVILSTTDGVGTKILLARQFKDYSGIGIDLVAMCVNDLLVAGAEPLQFLDYIACGRINEEVLTPIIKSIARGCELAEIILSGGETAELPDMYEEEDFDLAGFAVGVAEKDKILPQTDKIKEGDLIYGLPSSGVHSNGFSLLRKISLETDIYSEALAPTKIYTKEMKILASSGLINAAAHITGGGLAGNIQRVLPDHLQPSIMWNWRIPAVFQRIQESSGIETAEMQRVFNMGVGIAVICPQNETDRVLTLADTEDIDMFRVGEVARRK